MSWPISKGRKTMTNLGKYMNRGLLAVAGIGAILTLSEAANAASFTVGDVKSDPTLKFTEGDKVFSDFVVDGTTVENGDLITISILAGGIYQVNYDANPGGSTLTTAGSLKYKVSILPGFSNVFHKAGTNAQGNTLAGTFSKTLEATNLPTLVSTLGTPVTGTFSPGPKVIDVTSSWTVTGSDINSFSDQYTQKPVEVTPIPEPSAVLGLVALGLAGVVGRSVSKSLHNKQQ